MLKSLLLASVTSLGFTSVAPAAISIVVSSLGVPNDGNAGTVQGDLVGYHAYLVQANAGAGNLMTAVDLSSAGGRAITTTLHQAWFINQSRGLSAAVSPNSDVAVNNSGAASTDAGDDSLDSHFIFSSTDARYQLVAGTLSENNDAYNTTTNTRSVGTSPFVAFNGTTTGEAYGNGTTLSGAFALTGTAQAQLVSLAYLVIPDSLHLTNSLTVANGQFASTEGGFFLPIVIPAVTGVPEPTSIGLAAMSLGGLVLRRRRA